MSGLFDTMKQKGEERLGALTSDWLGNERFLAAVEAALSTKRCLERQLKKVLHTMSVASRLDIDELHGQLADSDRKLRQLQKRFEALQRQLGELTAARAPEPVAAAPAKPAPEPVALVEPIAPSPEPPAAAVPNAVAGSQEVHCVACGKAFQKKSFNQRYCSAACRSGV
jgi:hypothetical protein